MSDAPNLNLPLAPNWALAMGEVGRALVVLAALLFVAAMACWLAPAGGERLRRWGTSCLVAGSASLAGVFGILATLFVADRFEYRYVYAHGEHANGLAYKVAGVWSGQEGSLLLWACTSALFGLLALRKAGDYRRWVTVVLALVLASLSAMLVFESPFVVDLYKGQPLVPSDGFGLAPSLQNYWVVIHPPTIFLGFGLLIAPMTLALAAMLTGDHKSWVPLARPWAVLAMTLVGVGLCMGGLWAYETQGWGGFWAWDPVENTSFVPWCLCVILLHGLMVQSARPRWSRVNLLLGGLPFLAFVYGTFLTRSGLLGNSSVHSFAQMAGGSLGVLVGLLALAVVGYVGVWLVRVAFAGKESRGEREPAAGISRESLCVLGLVLLACLATVACIGMSIPMVASLLGRQPRVVDEALYYQATPPFFLLLIPAMALAPLVGWRREDGRALLRRVGGVVGAAVVVTILGWLALNHALLDPHRTLAMPFGAHVSALPWMLFMLWLCAASVAASAWRLLEMRAKLGLHMSGLLAHLGLGMLLAGLIVSRGLERKEEVVVQEGHPASAMGLEVAFERMGEDLQDKQNRVAFRVSGLGGSFVATPGFYYHEDEQGNPTPMVWPYTERRPFYDLYFSLFPMVIEASPAKSVRPGGSVQLDKLTLRYATKGREALFEASDENGLRQSFSMTSGPGDSETPPARVGDDYLLQLQAVDPITKVATVKLFFRKPYWPIDIYYKPLTGLVWLGTAVMTLAGLLTAWRYRVR